MMSNSYMLSSGGGHAGPHGARARQGVLAQAAARRQARALHLHLRVRLHRGRKGHLATGRRHDYMLL